MTDAQYEQYFNSADALVESAFGDAALRARIVTCTPAAMTTTCTRTIIAAFGNRAWRRPLAAAEVDRLTALAATATRSVRTSKVDQASGQSAAVLGAFPVSRRARSGSELERSLSARRVRARVAALVSGVEHDAGCHACSRRRQRRALDVGAERAARPRARRRRAQPRRRLRRSVARPARAHEPPGRADRVSDLGRAPARRDDPGRLAVLLAVLPARRAQHERVLHRRRELRRPEARAALRHLGQPLRPGPAHETPPIRGAGFSGSRAS